MLSILCVRLTIKLKVGIPESFKVGWYPTKKTGSSHLKVFVFNKLCYSCTCVGGGKLSNFFIVVQRIKLLLLLLFLDNTRNQFSLCAKRGE